MKDTSEFPDASEQTTVTSTRPKTTARSGRTDRATTGSQEHDAKAQTRRRPQSSPDHSSRSDQQSSTPRTSPQGSHPTRAAGQSANSTQRPERGERHHGQNGRSGQNGQSTQSGQGSQT